MGPRKAAAAAGRNKAWLPVGLLLSVLLLADSAASLEWDELDRHSHVSVRKRSLEHEPSLPPAGMEMYPDMEIVIARYREGDLRWLAELPSFYKITVMNKGGKDHPMPEAPAGINWTVIDLPNKGREAHTFAYHLVYRYDTLASYTLFSQADPFVHNLHYLELLRDPTLFKPVQTMSRLYMRGGDQRFVTPKYAVDRMSKHPWYRSERVSTRTLNSVYYHDEGSVNLYHWYLDTYRLQPGTNLIHHHLSLIGLPDWMPEEQEVASFAFGALVGFDRRQAWQHPKEVYDKLMASTTAGASPWLIERMWGVLFGGYDFKDS